MTMQIWMVFSTLNSPQHNKTSQAHNVKCTDVAICVDLLDGRTISAPLVWFPKLSQATKEQLDNWELLGDGKAFTGLTLLRILALRVCLLARINEHCQ